MEREVGYVGMATTAAAADGVERTFIVWYHPRAPGDATRVEGGDWVDFCRNRNQAY
jgi:hypothetical protein